MNVIANTKELVMLLSLDVKVAATVLRGNFGIAQAIRRGVPRLNVVEPNDTLDHRGPGWKQLDPQHDILVLGGMDAHTLAALKARGLLPRVSIYSGIQVPLLGDWTGAEVPTKRVTPDEVGLLGQVIQQMVLEDTEGRYEVENRTGKQRIQSWKPYEVRRLIGGVEYPELGGGMRLLGKPAKLGEPENKALFVATVAAIAAEIGLGRFDLTMRTLTSPNARGAEVVTGSQPVATFRI